MRFSIAIFATIALTALTSVTPVVATDARVQGVQSILMTLKDTVTPLAAQLASIRSNNATSAVVEPIIGNITTAISTATTRVKALKGQPQSVVLGSISSDEEVPLMTLNKLIVEIIILLVTTLTGLMKILNSTGLLFPSLPQVGINLVFLVSALLLIIPLVLIPLTLALTGFLAGLGGLVIPLGLGGLAAALGLGGLFAMFGM